MKSYDEQSPIKGYAQILHIDRDHIPPASFYQKVRMDSNRGPAVAISGFDHNSKLWRSCTTGMTRFHGIFNKIAFKFFSKVQQAFTCAIFYNLKCLRDEESKLQPDEKIFSTRSAFERYQSGFTKIVESHCAVRNIHEDGKNLLIQWISDSVKHSNLHDGWNKADKTLMSICCDDKRWSWKCKTFGVM